MANNTNNKAHGDCYLIADEVGLGKTKIAAGIIDGIARSSGRARVLYLASNRRIAKQNLEELNSFNRSCLKPFQQATVDRALKALGYTDFDRTPKKIKPDKIPDRLSMYYNTVRKQFYPNGIEQAADCSFALSFTPTTSFFQPSENAKNSSKGYDGSREEDAALRKSLELVKSHPSFKAAMDRSLYAELASAYKAGITLEYDFALLRRYFCNANAILFDPDVIVLDEFQRFRSTLEYCEAGYSVKQMIDFINDYRDEQNEAVKEANKKLPKNEQKPLKNHVKVIMLSATPYNFNPDALEIIWNPPDRDEADKADSSVMTKSSRISPDGEDPFDDFEKLKELMEGYGANINADDPTCYISRTERKNFFGKAEQSIFKHSGDSKAIAPSSEQFKDYLHYLASLYLEDKKDEDDKYIRKWHSADNFWKFTQGYSDKTKAGIAQNRKGYENGARRGKHLLTAALIRQALPKNAECLLWVSPTVFDESSAYANDNNPFYSNRKLGKTLVFSHYRMAAKSAAAAVSEQAVQRLIGYPAPSAEVNLGPGSFAYDAITTVCNVSKEQEADLKKALNSFFNRPYAKKAVLKATGNYDNYQAAVELYCEMGQLDSVIAEYRAVNAGKSDEQFVGLLCRILAPDRYGSYDNKIYTESGDKSDKKFFDGNPGEYTMGVYYTDDPAENETHNKSYEDGLGDRFNSPFYPFVLSVTSTAQEGLDFHYYADKLMHRQPAVNINAFQQREGRVNRPMSLTIRRRYLELFKKDKQFTNPADICDFFRNIYNGNPEEAFGRLPESLQSDKNNKAALQAGLFPMWYIPDMPDESNYITRIISATPFSDEYTAFTKLIEGSEKYGDFLGKDICLCPFNKTITS